MIKNQFLLFITICTLAACGKVVPPEIPPEQGRDYYPLEEIKRIYTVDSITFDLQGLERVQDTVQGFLRQRVLHLDSQWVMEISYRKNDSLDWEIRNFSPLLIQDRSIIEISNGAPLKKMTWPVKVGSEWEETALASSDFTLTVEGEPIQPFSIPWDVTVTQLHEPFEIGSFSFDHTLHKKMVDEDLLIEYRMADEIYARNVGLIYSKTRILNTQCEHKGGDIADCIEDAWIDKANSGFIAELKLISWE